MTFAGRGTARLMLVMSLLMVGAPCALADPDPPGLVIGFGTVLSPPYVFTGAESPILFLNDLQYHPQPHSSRTPIVATPEQAAKSARRFAVLDSAMTASQGLATRERLAVMERIFAASSLVRSTRIDGDVITVDWIDIGPERISLHDPVRPGPRSPKTPGAANAELMAQFWRAVNRGGVVAFGDDYFVIGGTPKTAAEARAALQELEAGRVPAELGQLLSKPEIKADVLRAYGLAVDRAEDE